jgi:integrase
VLGTRTALKFNPNGSAPAALEILVKRRWFVKPHKHRTTRQANGTGSRIRTLPSGLLRIDLSLGYRDNGKRDRRAVYGRTPEEVQQRAQELQYRYGKGLVNQADTITLGSWLTLWLASRKPFLEESSLERYEQLFKRNVPKRLKDLRLQAIRVSDLKALNMDLAARNLSHTSRAKTFQLLRAAFREALAQEIIVISPAEAVRVQQTKADTERKADPVQKALTDLEMDTFLIAAEGHELDALFYTMFALGLRVGEALGLRWSDIDFKSREVHIQQQAKIVRNKVQLGQLKTQGSKRKLPLSGDLIAVLEHHKWQQDKHKAILGTSWTDNNLVFASSVGTPRNRGNVNKAIQKIRAGAGIRPFSSHACRHTNITSLFRDGVDPEIIAKHAGHANSIITRSIYRTVFQEELPTVNLAQRRLDSRARVEASDTSNVPTTAESVGG